MPRKPITPHTDRSCCPIARALDIVGDHWSLLLIRDMLLRGKHEYKEFLDSPERIATNVLADRLRKLDDAGLIRAVPHPQYRTRKLYYPTESGKELVHFVVPLAAWAAKNLGAGPMPPEVARELRNDQKGMIDRALRQLREWERKYLRAPKLSPQRRSSEKSATLRRRG